MPTSSARVRSMTTDDAVYVASWRYTDRWSTYDVQSSTEITDELELYRVLTDRDDNVNEFLCVESAARVPGLDPDPTLLDVGVGMHPDLVGNGGGRAFGELVLDHLGHQYPGRPLRAVIQSWNVRSQRFAKSLGFFDIGELIGSRGDAYQVLLKPSSRGIVVGRSGTWLFGDRVLLREFVADDQDAVHAYASDPAVVRFTDWGPNSVADTRAFLDDAAAQRKCAARAEYTLAAVHIASGTVIGSGAISVTGEDRRRGELGYVVNRAFWSQGYATAVARLLVRFGLEHLRLRRVEATCDPKNTASARVLQKAGLSFEGLIRDHLIVKGVVRDSLLYRLDHDAR